MIALATPLFVSMAWADAVSPKQSEVRLFVDRAETCMHLSGELSGENTPGQMKLVNQVNKQCDSAKRQFKRLDKKYKKDNEVQAILDQYRDDLAD